MTNSDALGFLVRLNRGMWDAAPLTRQGSGLFQPLQLCGVSSSNPWKKQGFGFPRVGKYLYKFSRVWNIWRLGDGKEADRGESWV